MKRVFFGLAVLLLAVWSFSSCKKEETFDSALLVGKWHSGTLWYRYDADNTGRTWDTADDVTEDEAQRFTWTLEKADLTQIHIMEQGHNVPKYYTVTELTASTLKYKDDLGKSYSFTK